jgi:hypothetical protein
MRLVEILLPLAYPDGQAVPSSVFDLLKEELSEKFGGVTAYAHSPAEGLWRDGSHTEHDTIVIFEVMTKKLDQVWWEDLRKRLELLFRQEEVVIRAIHATKV